MKHLFLPLAASSFLFVLSCAAGTQRFDQVMIGKVEKRAEFDFECPRKELAVTKIDEGTYGVAGCGKRATYVGKISQTCAPSNSVSNLENYCQVVSDTFEEDSTQAE